MTVELHDKFQAEFEADAELKTLLGEENGKARVFAGWPEDLLEIACNDTTPGYLVLIEAEERSEDTVGQDVFHSVPDLGYELTVVSRDARLNIQVRDRARDMLIGAGPIDTTNYSAEAVRWEGSTPLSVLADEYRAALEMRFAIRHILRKTPIQPREI